MENKTKLHIVKIGGNIIDDPLMLEQFLSDFAKLDGAKILVNGGGKMATKTAEALGLNSTFLNGRRITDLPMLEVAVMVYAGWINKNIVAKLQSFATNAIGFTGADGNLIRSEKRKNAGIDFGFVGDVTAVNVTLLQMLLANGTVPVFSAITHDGNGQLLNTNADTIATEIAISCAAIYNVNLLYCFEKNGVLLNSEDPDSVIPELTFDNYKELQLKEIIHSGMLPKLENCFRAAASGVQKIAVGNSALLRNPNQQSTKIIRSMEQNQSL